MTILNRTLVYTAVLYLAVIAVQYYVTEKRVEYIYLSMSAKNNTRSNLINSCGLLNSNAEEIENFTMAGHKYKYVKANYSHFPIVYQELKHEEDSLETMINYFMSSGCYWDFPSYIKDDLDKKFYMGYADSARSLCQEYEMLINGIPQATNRYKNLATIPRNDSTLIEFRKYSLNVTEEKLDTTVAKRIIYIE